jgi:MFS family permease
MLSYFDIIIYQFCRNQALDNQLILNKNIKIYYISDMFRAGMFSWAIWYDFQRGFLSGQEIAFFSSLILFSEVIFQIPTGAFADIFGKKLTLIIGNLFIALATLIIGLYPSASSMLIFALFSGIGTAFLSGTHSALIYNLLINAGRTEEFAKIKSRGALFFQIFGAASIVAGSYMYQIGPHVPYIARAVVSILGVILSLYIIEIAVDKTKFSFKSFIRQNIDGFKELFKSTYMLRLTLLYVIVGGIAFSSQRFLVNPFMSELGMDEVSKGWTTMVIKVFCGFAAVWILRNAKISSHKYFLLIIPVLMFLILFPAKYFTLPWAYFFLLGIAFSSANADLFMSPAINGQISSKYRATALSGLTMMASLFNGIIQFSSGSFVENGRVGDYYQILGVLTLVFIIPLTISILKKQKRIKLDMEAEMALVGDDQ